MISLNTLGNQLAAIEKSMQIGNTGVEIHRIQNSRDSRGALAIVDFMEFSPFVPQRIFFSFDVPSEQQRGRHAHKTCRQFFLCLGGQCSVEVNNGKESVKIQMDSPIYGLSLPPMIWSTQSSFSPNSSLLVLASEPYREDDYVRDYEEFLALARTM